LIDGAVIGEYRLDADSIDLLMLCHPDYPISPDTIDSVPLAVQENDGSMSIVPLSNVARLIRTNAPQSIRRIEQLRSVTFTVIPSEETPLETASDHIMELIEPLRRQGQIASDIEINLAGTADKLSQVRRAMLGDWQGLSVGSLAGLVTSRMFLAILIVYLLMAALFESYTYPLVILFTVPLATVGGFLGLRLIRAFNPAQQLDTLTMLGFVILIGVVVNNAILIVHQALNFMRGRGGSETDKIEPLDARQAIRESVRSRIRPIFMTTTTSVCGMLPLVLMPGSGSELYKGLGSVIIGGLIIATLFTLIVVPLMLSLVIDLKSVFTASEQVE